MSGIIGLRPIGLGVCAEKWEPVEAGPRQVAADHRHVVVAGQPGPIDGCVVQVIGKPLPELPELPDMRAMTKACLQSA